MAITYDFTISKADWLNNPRGRWNKGLLYAGAAWKGEHQKYPPAPSNSSYIRKGGIRDKSDFEITEEGKEMLLRSTFYWRYLMFGTGIYGPKGTPIVPVNAKVLAWPVESGGLYSKGRDVSMAFAHSVRGYIWEGKLDSVLAVVKKAFVLGIQQNADI